MKNQLVSFLIVLFTLFHTAGIAQTVYVTKTGEKYHTVNCRYLRSSSIAMSLSEAQAGYTPCSVCRPPSRSAQKQSISSGGSRQASSSQCSGTTQAGNRCKKMTKSSNGRCHHHGG